MAPKRATASQKNKAKVQEGTSAVAARNAAPPGALPASRVGEAALSSVSHLLASNTHELGATSVAAFGSGRVGACFFPVFLHTLFAGLVPPFSNFLRGILEAYHIHLLHLHPNSILILSIFAYLCEAYVGVSPSVELFRSFYALRVTAPGEALGCVSFRIAPARSEGYIPIAWVGENAITKITKKVEDFRTKWIFVNTRSSLRLLEAPGAPPAKRALWASADVEDSRLESVYARIRAFRDAGLTGQMVVRDFTKRRIAPLQWRSKPVWACAGPGDRMCLSEGSLPPAKRKQIYRALFAADLLPSPASEDAMPLLVKPEEERRESREGLPDFDEWGIKPAGLRGPRNNPWADQEQAGEGSESEEGADSGEDEAPRGGNPSGGSAGSSGDALQAEDPQAVSSSDEDGAFRVVRSHRVEEEAEEESGNMGGRREPRSKASHDRNASAGRDAPQEDATKPQEEAGARGPQPLKGKKRVWRAADE